MTTDQIRDELAAKAGWVPPAATNPSGPWSKVETRGGYEVTRFGPHPMPPTLDGANAAVPEGWYWIRDGAATSHRPDGLLLRWVACERGANNWRVVEVPDTGDPVHDLYQLALACVRAEEAKR